MIVVALASSLALAVAVAQPRAASRGARVAAAEGAFALPEPVRLSHVEPALGERRDEAADNVRLMVSPDGGAWRAAECVPGRPVPAVQHPALGIHATLLCVPAGARALRLDRRAGERPWSLAGLRLYARP